MSAVPWTVGRYVVETIAANGIDTVFGIPGVHNLELYRGLELARLRHVLARHEQNAGFAADGYARATGRPAAAFVISGPGLTNILTAVGQAHSDSVPMLVVASTPVRASLGRHWGVLHELADQAAVAGQVAGFAASARTADEVREQLRAAFRVLRGSRPRPACLDIPLDLLAETTVLRPERFAAEPPPAPPERAALAQARLLLAGAARPLLICGGGARMAGAAVRELVEALDGYLVTTAAGKGVIAESHPANLGASLPYRTTQQLIGEADVIVAAGTELSETDIYTTTHLPFNGRLVRIDVDDRKLADQYAAEVPVKADAAATLELLAQTTTRRTGWRTLAGEAQAHRARLEGFFGPDTRLLLRFLHTLRAALPADTAVFSDMTQVAYLGNYAFSTERPGLWFHPSGYGTLGFALPAAIGAKVAQPARPIAAIAGDFGVQFTLGELMTAVELDLAIPLVVWNNEALGQIRDDMQSAGIAPIGVIGRNPDFVALANACGAAGVRVRSTAALGAAVRDALARSGPTLVEVVAAEFSAG